MPETPDLAAPRFSTQLSLLCRSLPLSKKHPN